MAIILKELMFKSHIQFYFSMVHYFLHLSVDSSMLVLLFLSVYKRSGGEKNSSRDIFRQKREM